MICACGLPARRGTQLCVKCFVAARNERTAPRAKPQAWTPTQGASLMKERAYSTFDPPAHRTRVHVKSAGKWHHAVYAAGDDPTFLLFPGWLEIGTDVTYRQAPPKPDFDAPTAADYRKRLPWWIREPVVQRRARHHGKDSTEWAVCWLTGDCFRCGGKCPNQSASAQI